MYRILACLFALYIFHFETKKEKLGLELEVNIRLSSGLFLTLIFYIRRYK